MEIDHITPDIVAAVAARVGKPTALWGRVDPRVILAAAHEIVEHTVGTPEPHSFIRQDPNAPPLKGPDDAGTMAPG